MARASPETLLLLGTRSPPIHGQSVAFDMLVEEVEARGIPHSVIDLADSETQRGGAVSWRRLLQYGRVFALYTVKIMRGSWLVYLTMAQSRHGFFRDLVTIRLASLFGHSVVGHLHGGGYAQFYSAQPGWMKWLIRSTLLKVRTILVLGEGLRSMFDFEPRLASRIEVVPNGLPSPPASIQEGKSLPTSSQDPIRILYLSNLIESKGFLELLEAVSILVNERDLRVSCHFCGEFLSNRADDVRVTSPDHARQLFESFVEDHELKDEAVYRGTVSGGDKEEELERAHFFVLPTSYGNEGQPIAIIEAMAYGCVPVSTDFRAIPDLIEHGESGVLLRDCSPQQIADAIGSLVADPERFAAMSRRSIERYRRLFTRAAHLDRLILQLPMRGGLR